MLSWIAMRRVFWSPLIVFLVHAQSVDEPTDLLRKVQSIAESANSWRAEVVERSALTGGGINLKSEVRTRIARGSSLKMRRENSGDDQTVLVCDGAEFFYSGDGRSYYRGEAKVNPQCDLPLSKFYELESSPAAASVVGRDRVRLRDGDQECVLVRTASKHGSVSAVRTMCIEPASASILRDVAENEDEKTGIRTVKTTTFTSFEINPSFPPDTFRFTIPPGAVEAKPPK